MLLDDYNLAYKGRGFILPLLFSEKVADANSTDDAALVLATVTKFARGDNAVG